MLSRAAERVYWTGRYLERAENTARIVQQYSHLFLDLPDEVGVEWNELVRIFGVSKSYAATGRDDSENEILRYLLADPDSTCSLLSSLKMARENVRNTRDLLPQESWENVNELYQAARERLPLAAAGNNRFEVLAYCIGRCQQIMGTLSATMSHRNPYRFLRLGQRIERADMTSRVLDVAASYIQQNETLVIRYGSTLWTNVLKSVSGFQMYRQYCQPEVVGVRVIGFLLRDRDFPRAVQACLDAARGDAERLPHHEATTAALAETSEMLDDASIEEIDAEQVTLLMDRLQQKLAAVHDAVAQTWFLPRTQR